MDQNEKHAIALMRYAAITPLVNGTKDEFQSLSSFFKEAALKPYPDATGSMRLFSPAAIERWYRSYLKSGFDGLMPKDRSDSGKSRVLDDACQEYIRHMKTQYPRLPAAAIYRQMLSQGLATKHTVSESSVNRFVNRIMEEKNSPDAKDILRLTAIDALRLEDVGERDSAKNLHLSCAVHFVCICHSEILLKSCCKYSFSMSSLSQGA